MQDPKKSLSTSADFDFISKLGKGSFGTVYKVKRKTDKKIYVMKQINIAQLDSQMRTAAVNEVKILASLENPYIVKYYDSFIEKNILNIVMEFCEGGDLANLLKLQGGRPVPESKIWKFFIQMCLGLNYIHSKKILHRDIKAMNVFLTKDEEVRIGDLGVAKMMAESANFAHTLVGTPYYLSPEMAEEKPYNEKSDVWALGCVLYELCTLRHPFEANNQAALFLKIIRGKYSPIPSTYSSDLVEVVDNCLSRDYKKRYSTTMLLAKPIVQSKARELKIPLDGVPQLQNAPGGLEKRSDSKTSEANLNNDKKLPERNAEIRRPSSQNREPPKVADKKPDNVPVRKPEEIAKQGNHLQERKRQAEKKPPQNPQGVYNRNNDLPPKKEPSNLKQPAENPFLNNKAGTPSSNRGVEKKAIEHMQAHNNLFKIHFGGGNTPSGQNQHNAATPSGAIHKSSSEKRLIDENQQKGAHKRNESYRTYDLPEERKPIIPRPNNVKNDYKNPFENQPISTNQKDVSRLSNPNQKMVKPGSNEPVKITRPVLLSDKEKAADIEQEKKHIKVNLIREPTQQKANEKQEMKKPAQQEYEIYQSSDSDDGIPTKAVLHKKPSNQAQNKKPELPKDDTHDASFEEVPMPHQYEIRQEVVTDDFIAKEFSEPHKANKKEHVSKWEAKEEEKKMKIVHSSPNDRHNRDYYDIPVTDVSETGVLEVNQVKENFEPVEVEEYNSDGFDQESNESDTEAYYDDEEETNATEHVSHQEETKEEYNSEEEDVQDQEIEISQKDNPHKLSPEDRVHLEKKLAQLNERKNGLANFISKQSEEFKKMFGKEKYIEIEEFFRGKMRKEADLNEDDQDEIDQFMRAKVKNTPNLDMVIMKIYRILQYELELETCKEQIERCNVYLSQ